MTADVLLKYLKTFFGCYDESFKAVADRLLSLEDRVKAIEDKEEQWKN
jgi:hypothetical protein